MLALIPHTVALGALLLLLHWLRRRYPEQRFGLWLAALLLIFVEEIARALVNMPGPWRPALHALALDCYALAGSIFFWGSFPTPQSHPSDRRYLLVSVPPLLAFLTLYAFGVTDPVWFYTLIGIGLFTGIWTVLRLDLSLAVLALRIVVLLLMAAAVRRGDLRLAAYLPLAYTYAFCAWSFFAGLPRGSLGRAVIVTGFSIWSLCFLTHSWIYAHPSLLPVVAEIWSLQSFAVILGMLLVVFEQQVDRNKHLALHDQLTGLPNRRLFEDRLRQAVLQAQRTGQRVALMVLDLDGFKSINDTLGHAVGDQFLCEVARTLRQSLRSYNTMARLGGDEFGIISPDLVPFSGQARSAADAIASSLHSALLQPLPLDPHIFHARCSIGIAIFPDDSTDLDQLQRIADARMYEHKRTKPVANPIPTAELQPTSAL